MQQTRYRPLGRRGDSGTDGGDPFAASAPPREPMRIPVRPSYRKSPPSETLLCLDIETVGDEQLLPKDLPEDKFPKPLHHRVVAISVVSARIERAEFDGPERYVIQDCRSGGAATWDEATLLRSFWKYFSDSAARLVTWNGRGFDMPVLRQRAMVYGVPTDWWYRCGDRWSSYPSRFSDAWHIDLMDVLADFGASSRLSLEEFATSIGLPGKMGEHGSKVAEMIAAGAIERVRAYCECDALNTYASYLRLSLATGRASPETYDESIDALVAYLESQADRPHLATFLATWRGSTRPAPMKVPPLRGVRTA